MTPEELALSLDLPKRAVAWCWPAAAAAASRA